MKKRILSIFLILVMLIQMLPMQVFAASNLTVNGGTITIGQSFGQWSITQLKITNNGSGDPIVVDSATRDGDTFNIVLAQGTSPSASLKAEFVVQNAQMFQNLNNTCTLSNGGKTVTTNLRVIAGQQHIFTYKIIYSIKAGAVYDVTIPTGEGFKVTGDKKVSGDLDYEFTVDILEGYQSHPETGLQVTVNGSLLTPNGEGKYVYQNVTGPLNIQVNGVVPKELWSVTKESGTGYTITSDDHPYKGEDYTFKVVVDAANYKIGSDGLKVLVNGEEGKAVDNQDGSYTIAALDGNITITVDGIVERENFTVTKPEVAGVIFNGGNTVREGKDYIFTLTVDDAYNASAMIVKNYGETIPLKNGEYTISKVDKAPSITIEGVVPKTKHKVELVGGEGYTITGDSYAYDGESYSFTVTLNKGYMADPETGLQAKLNDSKTVNLVSGQKYTVESVKEDLQITLTGVVESGVEPTVILSGGRKPNSSWGYVDTITVDQVQVENYKWVGDEAYIILTAKTSDTATAKVSFLTGGMQMGAMPDTEILLADGKADKSFTAKTTSFNYTWNFTLHFSNHGFAPTLAGNETETVADAYAGRTYTWNLAPLFSDVFDQTLTYSVQVGESAWETVDGTVFSFVPDKVGVLTLKFKASNGQQESTDVYTVKLNVLDATQTYPVTVHVPQGIEPVFYASNEAGDLVAELKADATGTVWTVDVPKSTSYLAWRADGWGGMAFAAKENGTVSLRQLQTNVVDYENNAAECTVTVKYDAHTAVGGENGWLLVTGQEYTYTAVPKDTATLATVTETETLENGTGIYTRKIGLNIKNPVTITVPKGATAQLYKYNKYYHNTELDAKIVKDSEDGKTTSYQFIADTKVSGVVYIYRVAMEGKITKSGWVKWGQQTLEVTYSDTDKSPDYRLDDYFSAGVMDDSFASEDSVLLNINSRNHLNLSVGQSKTLKAYRAWEIIPISYNNYIITPDFTYTVLSGEDVISLEKKESPSAGEGDWMTVTAKENGVAVIEVTYDAIDVSGDTRDYPYQGVYGASDPARTGLVVVQVGENDDTSVNFGIDCFTSVGISNGSGDSGTITYNPNEKKAWDAEFDTLYFTGDNGELRLQPTAGSKITELAVSNNKGAAWTTLTEKDGVYTAKIVSGNNIIRVKTESGTAYQVVRGDKVTYSVTEVSGKSNSDGKLEVGETVRVTLNGLHMPIPKMAGNYNPGAKDIGGGNKYTKPNLSYDSNGNRVYGTGTGQYAFINTNNSIEVTIPESGRIELTEGYIGLGEIGLDLSKGDSHRNIPDEGCVTRGSNQYIYTHCILPDITIVAESVDKTVPVEEVVLGETEKTINVGESFDLTATIKPSDATVQTVTWASSNEAVVRVTENGKVTAVGVGVATVTASAGEKTVECKITVTKIPVESVTLNFTSAELQIGKTLTLTADVEPENATNRVVTWKSSNEAVAAVSSGIVTAVDEGETTITAEADGKKAVCRETQLRIKLQLDFWSLLR